MKTLAKHGNALLCVLIFTVAYSATVEVDNRLTSLEIADETELSGAGGVILDALEIPAGARLVLDPIATPIFVTNSIPPHSRRTPTPSSARR